MDNVDAFWPVCHPIAAPPLPSTRQGKRGQGGEEENDHTIAFVAWSLVFLALWAALTFLGRWYRVRRPVTIAVERAETIMRDAASLPRQDQRLRLYDEAEEQLLRPLIMFEYAGGSSSFDRFILLLESLDVIERRLCEERANDVRQRVRQLTILAKAVLLPSDAAVHGPNSRVRRALLASFYKYCHGICVRARRAGAFPTSAIR